MTITTSNQTVAIELAVHLGREEGGALKTAEQIVKDVEAFMLAGADVKRALDAGVSPEKAYASADAVAKPYSIRVMRASEAPNVSMGLCFWSSGDGEPGEIFRVV